MQDNSLTHQADAFKYALYRALCCMDLIDFFDDRDKEILEKIPIRQMLQKQIEIIKHVQPTRTEVDKYKDEWFEFTTKLLM
jgi:hypothetical protein